MTYKDQIHLELPESDKTRNDLAVLQEQAGVLGAEVTQKQAQIQTIQSEIKDLEAKKTGLLQELNEIIAKGDITRADLKAVVENAVRAKTAELNAILQTNLEIQKALHNARQLLDSEVSDLELRERDLEIMESRSAARKQELSALEDLLNKKIKTLEQREAEIAKLSEALEARERVCSGKESELIYSGQRLTAKKTELEQQSHDLSQRVIALDKREELLALGELKLKDLEVRENALKVDLAEFESAKLALDEKENELRSIERDIKSRLEDVKQQQKALSAKLKEV